MFPVAMNNGVGFAVANTAEELASLKAAGYVSDSAGGEVSGQLPPSDQPDTPPAPSVESLRAQLDAAGIAYDRRWGVAKLTEALK